MPKVSRVGKFRQTAAAAAVAAAAAAAVVSVAASTAKTKSDTVVEAVTQSTAIPTSASGSKTSSNAMVSQESSDALSRGQRKRQAKKDQYLKRQKFVLSTLQLQRQEEQKKRIDGLDALKEALVATLNETTTETTPTTEKKNTLLHTNKQRKDLTAREVSHLGLVLEHPEFQTNPFETIQQHLKNTLAGQAKELEKESAIRAKKDEKAEAKKKKAKKAKLQDRGGKHRKKFKAGRSRS